MDLFTRVKNDHRSEFSNLSNWKEEPWKNQGFNGIRTRDLRVADALLYQLSYEATHWEPHIESEVGLVYLWYFSHMKGFCTRSMPMITTRRLIDSLKSFSTCLNSFEGPDNGTRLNCIVDGIGSQWLGV